MDKRRLKIISRVLDAVKLNFPDTIQFIEDCMEQEYSRENIAMKEVMFVFAYLEAKSWRGEKFLFCSARF